MPGGPAPGVLLRALGLWLPPSSAGLPSAVCLVQEVGLEAAPQLPGRPVCRAPSSCPQMGREPWAFESYQGPSRASWASAGWGSPGAPQALPGVTGQEQEGSLLVSALSAETSSLTTFCWTSKVSRGRRPASGHAPALGTHLRSSGQSSVLSPAGHAHLTDFNIATIIKDGERATALAGTKPYMGECVPAPTTSLPRAGRFPEGTQGSVKNTCPVLRKTGGHPPGIWA